MTDNERMDSLEKRIAALEAQIQAQPDPRKGPLSDEQIEEILSGFATEREQLRVLPTEALIAELIRRGEVEKIEVGLYKPYSLIKKYEESGRKDISGEVLMVTPGHIRTSNRPTHV